MLKIGKERTPNSDNKKHGKIKNLKDEKYIEI
jgi:hypothetical protein